MPSGLGPVPAHGLALERQEVRAVQQQSMMASAKVGSASHLRQALVGSWLVIGVKR